MLFSPICRIARAGGTNTPESVRGDLDHTRNGALDLNNRPRCRSSTNVAVGIQDVDRPLFRAPSWPKCSVGVMPLALVVWPRSCRLRRLCLLTIGERIGSGAGRNSVPGMVLRQRRYLAQRL